jgi:tripartite-type tricarboxylate transporter receptor subunit TctC
MAPTPHRRSLLRLAASALASASLAAPWGASFAQSANVVRLVVPFPPGASNDIIGRLVAEAMAKRSGTTWIVENKPGAGSQLGTDFIAKSPPDGLRLLLGATAGLGILPAIKPTIPYNAERDFTYLARVGSSPFALVVGSAVPAKDFAEFVRLAKAQPGKLRIGTAGVGSLDYMGSALLQSLAGIELNVIPYKGMAPVLTDLRGGHIDAAIVSPATIAPTVAEGKVRVLAVLDARRSSVLPDVPSAVEVGQPQMLAGNWWGIVGPAKLPPAVGDALRRDLQAVLADPAFRKSVEEKGFDMAPLVGEPFAQFVATDLQRWKTVAQKSKITLED